MRSPSGDSPTVQSYSVTNRPTLPAPAAPNSGRAAASTVHRLWVAVHSSGTTTTPTTSQPQVAPVSTRETASTPGGTRSSSRDGASPTSCAVSGAKPAARASSSARSARASSAPRKASSSFLSVPMTSSFSLATPTMRASSGWVTSMAWTRSRRMWAVRRNSSPVRMRNSVSVTAKWVNHQVRKPYRAAAGSSTARPSTRVVVVSRVSWRCAWSGSCRAHPMSTATGAQARRSGVTGCSRRSITGGRAVTSCWTPGAVTAPPIVPRPAR